MNKKAYSAEDARQDANIALQEYHASLEEKLQLLLDIVYKKIKEKADQGCFSCIIKLNEPEEMLRLENLPLDKRIIVGKAYSRSFDIRFKLESFELSGYMPFYDHIRPTKLGVMLTKALRQEGYEVKLKDNLSISWRSAH